MKLCDSDETVSVTTGRKASWNCCFSSVLVENCGLGDTPDWAAKEAGGHRLAGGLSPYVAQVCRFEDRSSPTGSWYSYIHVLLTIKLAGGMTAISLPALQA